MKKLFFTVLAMVVLLSSCGSRSNTQTNTHTHDDGSEHASHSNESSATPDQESFELKHDSTHIKKDSVKSEDHSDHEHSHENGEAHKH